jgi:hypothetical protein
MSYEIIVNPPAQYTIEYANQRGPQGPAGASLTVRELDGSPSVAATELVFANGALSVSGTVVTVASGGGGGTWGLITGTLSSQTDLQTVLDAKLASTFTKAQLDTAVTDGNVMYIGDAPTAHVHSASEITSGTLPVARGGTNRTALGTALQVLRTNAVATDTEWATLAAGGDALVANPLSQFAATTSAQLAGVISDETGTGALVFANTPTFVTPNIGAATGTSLLLSGQATALTLMLGDSTGPLLRNNAGTIEARNNANSALANMSASQFTASFFRDSTNQANYFGAGINARNTWIVAFSNDGTDFGTKDLSYSRNAAGVLQIGNGTANASGSLLLTNLTASGTVVAPTFTAGVGNVVIINGDGGAVRLQTGGFNRWEIGANHWIPSNTNLYDLGSTTNRVRDLYTGGINATGTVRLGTYTVGTLPSAAANTRALAYVTDSSVSTYGSVVAGGGSTQVMVLSDGSNWVVSGGGTSGIQKVITSGTAAPSGGADGDIYLQYT